MQGFLIKTILVYSVKIIVPMTQDSIFCLTRLVLFLTGFTGFTGFFALQKFLLLPRAFYEKTLLLNDKT